MSSDDSELPAAGRDTREFRQSRLGWPMMI